MKNCCSDSAHSRGVSLLINKNLNFESLYEYKSEDRQIVIFSIKYQNEVYTFCNIFAPNRSGEKIAFFRNLEIILDNDKIDEASLIIGGDWNTHSMENATKITDVSYTSMIRIIELFNLCDSYRLKHPLHEKGHTYVNPANSGTGSRIDYIFVADSIAQYINKCEVITSPAPDHKALILEIITKRQ